ncbi:phosphatase PAP2 family protein [Roseateles chitosanitabidus]|uniref:phosphatase PAP2 family protein n=1 Tax=Roseateles chitosanitabidus TaxID=65048 RepID=UPI00082E72D8|nr:phosphatase PAP2 family protein [Roseateles chitosanitabidus]
MPQLRLHAPFWPPRPPAAAVPGPAATLRPSRPAERGHLRDTPDAPDALRAERLERDEPAYADSGLETDDDTVYCARSRRDAFAELLDAAVPAGAAATDPLAWVWLLTFALAAVDLAWMLLEGWQVVPRDLAVVGLAMLGLGAPLALRRYRQDPRLSVTLESAVVLLLFQAVAACLSYLLVSLAPPLVDAALADWDAVLGFDWPTLRVLTEQAPDAVRAALRLGYNSGLPQILVVVLYLGFSLRGDPLRDFMLRYTVVTVAVILLSAPMPAAGAWKFFVGPDSAGAANLGHFEALRDGTLRTLALSQMQGLISMPSLHAAMAVLLAHALWATPLRWPALLLNLLMLAATPVCGGHYLVDVLAGIALALIAIAWRPGRPTPARPVPSDPRSS